jgi:hemolysin III
MGSLLRTMPARPRHGQPQAEELANSLSHGLALVAALAGGPYLIVQAARRANAAFVVGTSLFCATIVVLYLASTLYHALPAGRAKRAFRIIDHSSIFLLIAGSYTPFTLGVLRGAWGWALFGLIWGLALAGIVLKSVGKASHPVFSTGLYLLMGWLVVVAVDPLFAKVPATGLLWLLAGGLFYTAGVAFYATDSRLQFGHLIWHLFVMAGTTCHYLAVLWYAA